MRSNYLLAFSVALLYFITCIASGQERVGFIQILANPGTQVLIDGTRVGVTNEKDQGLVLTDVQAGLHRLRFERPGFKPLGVNLSVTPDAVTVYTLRNFAPEVILDAPEAGDVGHLEPQTGEVQISCLPVYCSISITELGIEDYVKGSAPLTLADVLATSYQIEIENSNDSLTESITVTPNATLELFADFVQPRPQLRQSVVKRRAVSPRDSGTTPVRRSENTSQSYQISSQQPIAVLIDNADAAYPQQGLVQASSVYEMPVEGGMTRLMSVYTRDEPVQVGPIRDARDYFLEAALQLGGTLVHVGGAPSTVNRIASENLPTLDALQQGAFFAQAPDRLAPHNTFSTGAALRDAVGYSEKQVTGTVYVPPNDAPNMTALNVRYSESYSSGFRYLSDLDLYRWVRSGADATDTEGEAITADAVVVAQVTAFPYPDDPEGRLYLPYSGGAATLYLRGKAIAGSWTPDGGFSFVTESGVPVDLTPFKTWLLFTPETAEVAQH